MTNKFKVIDGVQMALRYFEINAELLANYLKTINEQF
jgi:hypothetical protein